MPICGPKLSLCCTVLSTWGVVMLAILGGFFRINAVALIEDIPLSEEITGQNLTQSVLEEAYTKVSNNCFIAAGIYLAFLIFSGYQYKVNQNTHYQIS